MASGSASRPPFFVVGCPRSGTTLVRYVLASHPALWLPDESGFLPYLRTPATAHLGRTEIVRLAHRIATLNPGWSAAARTVEDAADRLAGTRLGEVLDVAYRDRMGGSGAVRWGDKTPGYVHHLDVVTQIFDSARVVHVVRDGRAATVSALRRWGGRLPQRLWLDEVALLRRWRRAVSDGREAGRRLGSSRYLELRYEDLVAAPEAEIRRLCLFLEEPFEPAMLTPERLARDEVPEHGHVEVRRPIHAASVGRWRTELSPAGRWAAGRIAGDLLAELGYDPDPVDPPPLAGRLRLVACGARAAAVDGVRHLAEAAGWARLNRGKRRPRRT